MNFLCKTNDAGPHFLHVHDEPSYHSDVLRHAAMGWKMKWNYCLAPDVSYSSGDPGVKPFQVLDLTAHAPNTGRYRDDHHTFLKIKPLFIPVGDIGVEPYDLDNVRTQIQDAFAMGAEFLGYGDYIDAFTKKPPEYRPELADVYQDERGDL